MKTPNNVVRRGAIGLETRHGRQARVRLIHPKLRVTGKGRSTDMTGSPVYNDQSKHQLQQRLHFFQAVITLRSATVGKCFASEKPARLRKSGISCSE